MTEHEPPEQQEPTSLRRTGKSVVRIRVAFSTKDWTLLDKAARARRLSRSAFIMRAALVTCEETERIMERNPLPMRPDVQTRRPREDEPLPCGIAVYATEKERDRLARVAVYRGEALRKVIAEAAVDYATAVLRAL